MSKDKITVRAWREIKKEESGVLGLPLNMLIMVVIAAVAIGIILAWLFLITPPLSYIEVDKTTVNEVGSTNATFSFTVTAYNDDGPMSGCDISVKGPGIDTTAITEDDGSYTFTVTPDLPPNTNSDFIDITVSGGGNTVTQRIALNKL